MSCNSGQVVRRGDRSWLFLFSLFSLLVIPTPFSSPAHAACVQANHGILNTVNWIKINKVNWGNGTSVETAMSMWNPGGGHPLFCTGCNPPSGTFAILNVERVVGIAPDFDVCGTFQGQDVKVYTHTLESSTGDVVSCTAFGMAQNVAHEFGHRLGLADAPAGASPQAIMAQVNGQQHSIQTCEKAKAQEINKTIDEVQEQDQDDGGGGPGDSTKFAGFIVLRLPEGSWELTDVEGGVLADLDGDGVEEQCSWTALESELGFLFSDRDGDGCASSYTELFGDATPGPGEIGGTYVNGFEALVEWDTNHDGWVTVADAGWNDLRLWVDRNHNGICDSTEVSGLLDDGVAGLGLEYSESGKNDQHGNIFELKGKSLRQGGDGKFGVEKIYGVLFMTP